jgi:hypothetical protein
LLRSLLDADRRQELNAAAHSMRVRPLATALHELLEKNPKGKAIIPQVFKWVVGISLEEGMAIVDRRVLTTTGVVMDTPDIFAIDEDEGAEKIGGWSG